VVQVFGDFVVFILLCDLIEGNEFLLVKEDLIVVGEVVVELHLVDLVIDLFDDFLGFSTGGKEGFLFIGVILELFVSGS
jgi:hypothetical protein